MYGFDGLPAPAAAQGRARQYIAQNGKPSFDDQFEVASEQYVSVGKARSMPRRGQSVDQSEEAGLKSNTGSKTN